MTLRRALAAVCLLLWATPAWSQSTPDPWEQMRFRTGPLSWTPTVQIKNLGWDTNVFNQVENAAKDFTFTAGPQVDWWLRAGRARVHGTDSADIVYYSKYDTERAFNHSHNLTVEYALNRVRPYVGGSYLNTKDRPGYEIDARARHTESEIRAGAVARLAGRTHFDLSVFQRKYRFIGDQVFLGSSLSELLNRRSTGGSGTLSLALTPLTTVSVLAEAGQERFDESPERDNDSLRIMPGLQFDPAALLKGSARVGFRRLNMKSPAIPDFSGLVANVDISYVLLGRTRLSVGVNRDIQFSYDATQPYYVLTGVSGSVRQGLGRGVDIEARAANQQLAYRRTVQAPSSTEGQVDVVLTAGGGVGYRLGPEVRVSFNADYYRRRSDAYGRDFKGLRAGLAVNYGF